MLRCFRLGQDDSASATLTGDKGIPSVTLGNVMPIHLLKYLRYFLTHELASIWCHTTSCRLRHAHGHPAYLLHLICLSRCYERYISLL